MQWGEYIHLQAPMSRLIGINTVPVPSPEGINHGAPDAPGRQCPEFKPQCFIKTLSSVKEGEVSLLAKIGEQVNAAMLLHHTPSNATDVAHVRKDKIRLLHLRSSVPLYSPIACHGIW